MKVVDYKKENKGITLIALIITIIVLLILAGVTISFVMQGGILDKSQLAVEEYKNSANDEDNTLKDMDKYLDKQMNIYENGGVDMEKAKEDLEKNPEKYKHPDQEGTNGDRAVGTDGKAVNMDLWDGWRVEEGSAHLDEPISGCSDYPLYTNSNIGKDGKIKGTVPQYIYSEADEKVYTVVSMDNTFKSCTSLKVPPKIPNTVTRMNSTFEDCIQLQEAPEIPEGVTDLYSTFEGCSSLQKAPKIPNTVTSMSGTFAYCSALTEAPVIPNGVTNMFNTFLGCSTLTEAPVIPDSVIDMSSAFLGCSALTEAPVIPDSVTEMWYTFYECSALTGDLIINAENVEVYEECLAEAATNPGCELKLSGDCPQLNEILGTATSGNVSLKQ